jgi:hypothetical protein
VQALLSSQAALLLVCVQPVAGTQASVVHWLLSSQTTGVCVQPVCGLHASVSQRLALLHELLMSVWKQPVAESQPSCVHALPSLQLPLMSVWKQPEAESHPSVVHGLPSLHRALMSVWKQPEAGVQPSVVHALPSLQLIALCEQPAAPWFCGMSQTSVVHAFRSSHESTLVCFGDDWLTPGVFVTPSCATPLTPMKIPYVERRDLAAHDVARSPCRRSPD